VGGGNSADVRPFLSLRFLNLRSGLKIAVGGKGGAGKTTVCAILAKLFAQEGGKVVAIDADPDANLASAFGLPAERTPQPLIEMKELIEQRTGAGRGSVGTYFKLNPKVSDLPDKFCVEVDGLKLLVLGGVEQAGSGCACPESAFLKALLTYTILQRQEIIIVDLAAGVEFMGRASVQGIDALIVVVEPGARSIETAQKIVKMARQMGIRNVAVIANKITEDSQVEIIGSQLKGVAVLASLRYNPSLLRADLGREPVFGAAGQLVDCLRDVKTKLIDLTGAAVNS
jgi:CO dehydrogenase maturation factor